MRKWFQQIYESTHPHTYTWGILFARGYCLATLESSLCNPCWLENTVTWCSVVFHANVCLWSTIQVAVLCKERGMSTIHHNAYSYFACMDQTVHTPRLAVWWLLSAILCFLQYKLEIYTVVSQLRYQATVLIFGAQLLHLRKAKKLFVTAATAHRVGCLQFYTHKFSCLTLYKGQRQHEMKNIFFGRWKCIMWECVHLSKRIFPEGSLVPPVFRNTKSHQAVLEEVTLNNKFRLFPAWKVLSNS